MHDLGKFFESNDLFCDLYQKKVFYRAARQAAENLLVSKVDFDRYMARPLRASEVRIAKLGHSVSPYQYTYAKPPKWDGTQADDCQVDISKVLSSYRDGYTIVLQKIETINANVFALLKQLESKYRWSIQANAYLTPKSAQGFPAHIDNHDVLIYQVFGEKEWVVYDKSAGFTEESDLANFTRDEIWRGILKPGDILYIPTAFPHEARTGLLSSGHITLGIHPPKVLDFFKFVLERLAMDSAALRQSITVPLVKGDLTILRDCAEIISRRLSTDLLQMMLSKFEEGWIESRVTQPIGTFMNIEQLDSIDQFTMFVTDSTLSVKLDHSESNSSIYFDGATIRFPSALRDMLDVIFSNRIFSISQLPGSLSFQHKKAVIAKLVGDGVLTIIAGSET